MVFRTEMFAVRFLVGDALVPDVGSLTAALTTVVEAKSWILVFFVMSRALLVLSHPRNLSDLIVFRIAMLTAHFCMEGEVEVDAASSTLRVITVAGAT